MKQTSKFFDLLELVSSAIFICFLVVVLWFSLKFWTIHIVEIKDFNSKMYSTAILIAITTVIAEWVNGRIKSIVKNIQRLKQKKEVHYGIYE